MNLKFRPIINQTATFTYSVAKVISDIILSDILYLGLLCKNQNSIDNTQKFQNFLSSCPPLQDVKIDKTYNPRQLFVNTLIEESISYILKQIYVKKKMTPVCSKLIFRRYW